MKTVIIAAGAGSRLMSRRPKTLLQFGNGTILSTIIENMKRTAISDIVIVVGFEGEQIREYIAIHKQFQVNIEFVENPQWKRGNGISVLAVKEAVGKNPFLLSMSDHIVSVAAIDRIKNYNSDHNLLLVDPKIEGIFDIDDATKVMVNHQRIVDIGKEITRYNAIDCGLFRLTPRFFDAMAQQSKIGRESISAGVQKLIEIEDMEAVFLEKDDFWIDIDTPESYQYAQQNFIK